MEDFIAFTIGSDIVALLPLAQCQNVEKVSPSFDSKFLSLNESYEFHQTSIRDAENLFSVIDTTVKSSPNGTQATTGVDKQSLEEGLIGNKKFGCNVRVCDSSISTLVKWKDVSCGGRKGLMVSFTLVI